MGYVVQITEGLAAVDGKRLDEALAAVKAINGLEHLKTGGTNQEYDKPADSRSVAQTPSRWFAWLEWNYDEVYDDLAEVLNHVGFDTYYEGGDLVIAGYDRKSGAQDHFLAALAPYVVNPYDDTDPYLQWLGEDGSIWRTRFSGGRAISQTGHIIWTDDE